MTQIEQRALREMNRKTIYIAGPMAGKPLYNFPAFYSAEERLARLGWFPVNPAKYNHIFGNDLSGKILDAVCESERAAIPFLDAIYLLKGWEESEGARRELEVALKHNLNIILEGSEE